MEFDNPVVWGLSFVLWLLITVLILKIAASIPLKMKIFVIIAMAFLTFFIVAWQVDQ